MCSGCVWLCSCLHACRLLSRFCVSSRVIYQQYILAFLIACHVMYKVFDEVHIVFLPVGHTHAKIDQRFSVVHQRLMVADQGVAK